MKASNHPGGLSQPTPLRQPGPPSLWVARLIFASFRPLESWVWVKFLPHSWFWIHLRLDPIPVWLPSFTFRGASSAYSERVADLQSEGPDFKACLEDFGQVISSLTHLASSSVSYPLLGYFHHYWLRLFFPFSKITLIFLWGHGYLTMSLSFPVLPMATELRWPQNLSPLPSLQISRQSWWLLNPFSCHELLWILA